MDAINTIINRASVRRYKKKAIPKDILERLVDAGRRAPTARAVEPWEFVIVSDRGLLDKLSKIANTGRFIKDAGSCIVIFCKDTKYYLEDGCAATENILLAAAGLGLGACWVAGDKKPYSEEVSSLLKAPTGLKLISLLSIGWPDEEAKQSKKRTLEDVIHWESF